MKIVHYIDALRQESGGIVRAVYDLSELMSMNGHDIIIYTYDDSDIPQKWVEEKSGYPSVHRLDNLNGKFKSFWLNALQDADALHIHTIWDKTLLPLVKVSRAAGVKIILTVHGALSNWPMSQKYIKKRIYYALILKKILHKVNCVHFTANKEHEQSRKWIKSSRVAVVSLAFNLLSYQKLPGIELAY